MANPKKPTQLKVLSNTVQPCRVNGSGVDLPLLDEVPPAPPWMPNAHAVNEYDRLAPILHANKLLTEAGIMALAHLCAIHGKMVQLWAAGECPTGQMLSQYRSLINDFALTPVAQGRVKVGGTDAKKQNAFANNGPKALNGGKK